MKLFSFIVLLGISICVNAQKMDSLSVFFKVNQYTFDNDQKQQIQQHLNGLKKYQWDTLYVTLEGFADVSASDQYNLQLSEKRIKSVKSILKSEPLIESFSQKAFGEKGRKPEDKAYNRRVDICFYGKKHSSKNSGNDSLAADSLILVKTQKPVKKVYKDSLVIVGAMEITIPKEIVQQLDENKEMKVSFEDISPDNDSGRRIYTQDEDGNPLISAGMFVINVKGNPDSCFKHPVVIRIPKKDVTKCYRCPVMEPYDLRPRGWQKQDTSRLKIKEIKYKGQDYYEVTTYCPGGKNLDCKTPSYTARIKARSRYYALDSVIISNGCRSILLRGLAMNEEKKMVKMKLPCSVNGLKIIYFETKRETGERIVSTGIEMKSLKRRGFITFCRKPSGKIMPFAIKATRLKYRKSLTEEL